MEEELKVTETPTVENKETKKECPLRKIFIEGTFEKKNLILTCVILVLALVITILTGITYQKFKKYQTYFDKSNVTYIAHLGDYSPKLTGVAKDTEVYVIAGPDADVSENGIGDITNCPSILIMGGTHPNEPSGQVTATLFLENALVERGILYVITELNRSAYSYSQPQEATTWYYHLKTASGKTRTFKYGSRATNTTDQWPTPDVYTHSSGQQLSSSEVRNINRAYPGSENGTYTEQIAWAITNFVNTNDVTIVIDLHEASPEYLTINACVYHQDAIEIGRAHV